MSEPSVDAWRPRGVVSLWGKKHRRRDWNLTADDAGCDALIELCERMAAGRRPSKQRLPLVRPSITADDGGARPFSAASHWTIQYPKKAVAADHWELTDQNAEVLLVVGAARLEELRQAVVDLRGGGGDYRIGGDESPLWIWWYVESC